MAKTNNTSGPKLTAAERRVQAMQLRTAGATYDQIAKQIGISTSRAHQIVKEELARLNERSKESAELYRHLIISRLESLNLKLMSKAKAGDLKAIDRALKVNQELAKIWGIYAPEKIAPTTPDGKQPYQPLPDDIDEVERRIAELQDKYGGQPH